MIPDDMLPTWWREDNVRVGLPEFRRDAFGNRIKLLVAATKDDTGEIVKGGSCYLPLNIFGVTRRD